MTSPQRTSIRRGIVALAAALLLAALAVAGSAGATAPTASAQEPPPVSCIVDSPVGPPGPGFVLSRGKFTTIDVPGADVETAPYGINNRGQIVGGYDTAGVVHGFLIDRGRYKTIDFQGAARTTALRSTPAGRSWATTRTRAAGATASCWRKAASRRSTSRARRPCH
jgi:hypothetical protein